MALLAMAALLGGVVPVRAAAGAGFEIVEISPLTSGAKGQQPQPLFGVEGKAGSFGPSANQLGTRATPAPALGLRDLALPREAEPNGTSATANAIASGSVVLGNIFPAADTDFYSFAAAAGDRVYAATQGTFSASGSPDTALAVIDTDGTTVLETDPDDGTFGASSSSIAGTLIPAAGTYFLRVTGGTGVVTVRPYHLHVRVQSGAPTPEVEVNNTTGTANPLPANGWMSGTVTAVMPGEADFFSLTLAAGDSVFLSLDMNPERDATFWNGRLAFGLFGNAPANQLLLANDANAGSAGNPNSEAFFFTVKDPGTYFVYVDSIVAAGLGANATYQLSVSVYPSVTATANCTTYTSTDVPQAIPTGPGMVSSTLTVPGNPRIADLNVTLDFSHTFMQDLDVHLVSPAGNDNGIFTDIGGATVGGLQTSMNLVLDDEAALPFAFALSASMHHQPELAYRLSWFDGEDAGGTWTLVVRDDAAGDGGTINAWSLTVCEPPPPPACPSGFIQETVFTNDFEAGDGGFTHSGTADEWERGLPTFVPITTCNSGTNCWKTDLDNSYNATSNQNLLSPNINLAGLSAPVVVSWAQRYHMESASFDHFSVDLQPVGVPASAQRLFEWRDATMNNTVGNPGVTVGESSGWSDLAAQADSFAGQNVELVFHLDTDNTVQLAGAGIDDVSVTACRALSSDLSITKTDGVASAVPGASTIYTITAANAGPDDQAGATVADTFPAACASVSWTCVGAGGGTCTAGPVAGNINDPVNLPAGGSVIYTATCNIAAAATGALSNTATVSGGNSDPNPANNSATDTDSLTPMGDVAITKTDGLTNAVSGQAITYTIVASNPGPSDGTGFAVDDLFPAALTGVSWTCAGTGGGTCTAGPIVGDLLDTINLPAGAAVTYTVNATISGAFTGTLSNTALINPNPLPPVLGGGPPPFNDPNAANNTATDTTLVGAPATPPDVAASKTVTGNFAPGGAITYTVVLSNSGETDQGDNAGDEFTDVLPASLTLVSASATGGTAVATLASNTVTWNGIVPAAGSVTITIDATIDADATGTISNQGTVSFDSDGNGTNETTEPTDDPGVGGPSDPTDLGIAPGTIAIPTLSTLGFGFLVLALLGAGMFLLRRRSVVRRSA